MCIYNTQQIQPLNSFSSLNTHSTFLLCGQNRVMFGSEHNQEWQRQFQCDSPKMWVLSKLGLLFSLIYQYHYQTFFHKPYNWILRNANVMQSQSQCFSNINYSIMHTLKRQRNIAKTARHKSLFLYCRKN